MSLSGKTIKQTIKIPLLSTQSLIKSLGPVENSIDPYIGEECSSVKGKRGAGGLKVEKDTMDASTTIFLAKYAHLWHRAISTTSALHSKTSFLLNESYKKKLSA